MFCGLGEVPRGKDVQPLLIAVEGLGVELGYLLGGFALGQSGGNDLVLTALQHLLAHVAYIGYVLDGDNPQSLALEGPANPVGH